MASGGVSVRGRHTRVYRLYLFYRANESFPGLFALLDNPILATDSNMSFADATKHPSNLYYTVIPYTFGCNRPPVTRSSDMLKKEIELIDLLPHLSPRRHSIFDPLEAVYPDY